MAVPTVTLKGSACHGIAPHLMSADLLAALPQTVCLGRNKPEASDLKRMVSFGAHLDFQKVAPPASVDYATKAAPAVARMYLNDRYGDCVIAGKYHTVGVWSANDTPNAVLGTDQEVYSMYQRICGPGDNGCVIVRVLDYMKTKGLPFGGRLHKIDGYAQVNWTDKVAAQTALFLFANLTIGIDLPQDWTENAIWDVTDSQIVGGHDVMVIDFNEQGVRLASWGRLYLMTWAAFNSRRWISECYVLLGPDWYNSDKLAPSGVNVDTLMTDLALFAGGQTPPIPDPTPPPPPPPPPGGSLVATVSVNPATNVWQVAPVRSTEQVCTVEYITGAGVPAELAPHLTHLSWTQVQQIIALAGQYGTVVWSIIAAIRAGTPLPSILAQYGQSAWAALSALLAIFGLAPAQK